MYITLGGFPLEDKALERLRRCAFIVAPIMRRHGWQMPILSELIPSDSCLGKSFFTRRTLYGRLRNQVSMMPREMHLRLRHPKYPAAILPIKQIMRTVLHELAHFAHRSHFWSFYRFNAMLLAELEYDVGVGCHVSGVSWREVPVQIASEEEMRASMMRDAKKKIKLCFKLQREES